MLPSCDLKAVRVTTVIKDATYYHFGSLIAWKLAAVLFCFVTVYEVTPHRQ